MSGRSKNRGLIFLRRSSGRQEVSLQMQLEWALREATNHAVIVDATLADLEFMQARGLHTYKSIRLDDAVSGADLDRPGMLAAKTDAVDDKTISHMFVYRRDRFARPQDAIEMVGIEKAIRQQGVTFVMSDKIAPPLDRGIADFGEEIGMWFDYYQSGQFLVQLAERVIAAKVVLGKSGYVHEQFSDRAIVV